MGVFITLIGFGLVWFGLVWFGLVCALGNLMLVRDFIEPVIIYVVILK
jgi:hypothetical protein